MKISTFYTRLASLFEILIKVMTKISKCSVHGGISLSWLPFLYKCSMHLFINIVNVKKKKKKKDVYVQTCKIMAISDAIFKLFRCGERPG